MERYGEKLTRLIKEAGYKKPNDFYKKVKELYGTETFARFTLTRILKDQVKPRFKNEEQIANALDLKASYIREGTNIEQTKEDIRFSFSRRDQTVVLDKGRDFNVHIVELGNITYKFLPTEFNDKNEQSPFSASALLKEILKKRILLPNKKWLRGDLTKLNHFLKMKDLYSKFPRIKLPTAAVEILNKKAKTREEYLQLNRAILEAAFPDHCPKIPPGLQFTAEMKVEKKNVNDPDPIKWIFVTQGRINLILIEDNKETKIALSENQNHSFDPRKLHKLENLSVKASKLLIINSPPQIPG